MSHNHRYGNKRQFMCGSPITVSTKDGDFIKQAKCTLLKVTSLSWIWTFMKKILKVIKESFNITQREESTRCGCWKKWQTPLMNTGFTVSQSQNMNWDMMEKGWNFTKASISYGKYKVTFLNDFLKKLIIYWIFTQFWYDYTYILLWKFYKAWIYKYFIW